MNLDGHPKRKEIEFANKCIEAIVRGIDWGDDTSKIVARRQIRAFVKWRERLYFEGLRREA